MTSVQSSLAEIRKIVGTLDRQLPKVLQAAEVIDQAFQAGHKLLAAGNGGSAADALHFTCEFEGKFRADRRGYPALCLGASASFLTAWSNDYSFDSVFVRQVETHGNPGDVFVGISTSGGSPDGCSRNIGLAAARARELGLATIGLAGKGGGMLREISDVCIVVESDTTARVQEAHGILLHLIVEAFEGLALPGGHAAAAGVLAQAGRPDRVQMTGARRNGGHPGGRSGWIAGLNHGDHDASAALLHNGGLVVAVEQERLSRRKRAVGEAPAAALKCCLDFAGIELSDLDVVALGADHDALARWLRLTAGQRAADLPFDQPGRLFALDVFGPGPRPPVVAVGHHRAHAASAWWPSGFDQAAILVTDAMGDDSATTLAVGNADGITDIRSYPIDTSLGFFYESAAEYTGLTRDDAGKFMGLAAYGKDSQEPLLGYGPDGITWPVPATGSAYGRALVAERMDRLLGHFESSCFPFLRGGREEIMAYADFAASVQRDLGQVFLGLAADLRTMTGTGKIVLAGGVALNCTANGLLAASGIFDEVFVQPMAHDAGVALGAALEISRQLLGDRFQPAPMTHAQWGTGTSDAEAEAELRARGLPFVRFSPAELARRVASLIAAGNLVAWHQGRAEVGPRSLGARSLLADPRRRSTLVRVNQAKHREMWRPLAPSVLRDRFAEFFVGVPNPFMNVAAQVRPEARSRIPAVVHVDGSSRPQAVDPALNPLFGRLLEEFDARCGVPVLVNTSLNLAGEPIVNSAADSIKCFLRSDIDVLAIGTCLVAKGGAAALQETAGREAQVAGGVPG